VLHHPNVPQFRGIESFQGAWFHSARWNHSVPVDGKRVGVVGTGSTAVQITSALVPRVAKFTLFQRTAQWVLAQVNPAYTKEEQETFARDPKSVVALRANMSVLFSAGFANAVVDANSAGMHAIEEQCLQNLESNVRDPVLREKLRPNYRAACKRLVISPDFYEAIQHPNAELVTSSIDHIEPKGVRTQDGRLHELDVLVLATGFRADRFMRPTRIFGRGGLALDDVWARRPSAYLSISVPGFPNLFMLNGPNGPVGNFSLIEVAELQMTYILQLVELLRAGRFRGVAPSARIAEAFETARTQAAKGAIWSTGCKSWYLDDRGVPASWPWTFDRFREEMARPNPEAWESAG
jgi:cation diffusion facilitator CzcD-associated flavoprotein CzcO